MGLFSMLSGDIIKSVGDAVDSLVTSDEERYAMKNKMAEIQVRATEKAVELEKEVTKRWVSDNENIITRLVRPLSFLFVLILFGSIVVADGNIGSFTINSAYIPVIQTLLVTMTVAYFGSRGAEKSMKIFKDKK